MRNNENKPIFFIDEAKTLSETAVYNLIIKSNINKPVHDNVIILTLDSGDYLK